MRKISSFFAAAIIMMAVGCSEPAPVDHMSILSSDREMRLEYRFEMQSSGVGVAEERFESVGKEGVESGTSVVKHEETQYTSTEWTDVELPIRVSTMPDSDSLRVTMTIRRFRAGYTYAADGQKKHEESSGFEAGDAIDPTSELNHLRDAEFIAEVDPRGQMVSSDITGEYWTKHKKELNDSVGDDVPKSQIDMTLRLRTPGVFAALEDAMAYLPPEEARAGRSWAVQRKYVLPYHAYGFYMCTNGCSYSEEKSTCTIQSVKKDGGHSIATVVIRGRRFPHDPERSLRQRVKYFELNGELKVDLDTGAVEKLRIESMPIWVHSEDKSLKIKFIEVIMLKPV